ncbi:glutaminyl-peptide cyclotransferase-like [Phragmites australis]|uniref:glutaminyl-peptide cyclotransferase-like n=1 Tax=Phragmites australis TaxID=29695 RepID=UPI002D76CAA7|nr:glutaminyl-peptide cyclotransferase-like [Phragmites australis]
MGCFYSGLWRTEENMGGKRKNSGQVQVRNRNGGSLLAPDFSTAQRQRLASPPQMPVGSRRSPPPPHLRRAMPPASFSVSATTAIPPPPPLLAPFFESTGLYHRSSVRKVELRTGKVLDHHQMDGNLFGEGLTLFGNRLFQVTCLKNDGFIYDRHNFSKCESFTHKMRDGWGLATDRKVPFGSDGTSKLYQLDPKSFEVMKMVTVKYQDNEVPYLNELEYIDGEVWANVWQTDRIARVSPEDGLVVGWIFLHELRRHLWNSGNTNIDVLNGIAWDEENHRLFLTEKLWPKLYEIKLRPVDGPADGSVEMLCPKASLYR